MDPPVEPASEIDEERADERDHHGAAPSAGDGTFALRPGERAYVTLRGHPGPGGEGGTLAAVAPIVIPEAGKGLAAPLMVLPAGGNLPGAGCGVRYSAELEAFGGTRPYSWSASLPPGLALTRQGSKGVITGVPLAAGRHEVVVRVDDDSPPSSGVTRRFVLDVRRALARLEIAVPAVVQVDVPVLVAVRVVPEGEGAPSGTVNVQGGDGEPCSLVAPGGTCTLEFGQAGERTIKATYEGDLNFEAADDDEVRIEVIP